MRKLAVALAARDRRRRRALGEPSRDPDARSGLDRPDRRSRRPEPARGLAARSCRRAGRAAPAQHRRDRRRRPRLQRSHVRRRRHRERRRADAEHRRHRARGRRVHARLHRQRHLRAVARGDHDRPLPAALRLRVHARAEGVHAPRRLHAPRRAAPAGLLRRPRGRRARDGGGGHPARGDHDRGAVARARLPHARLRQVAPRRGAADAAERAGLRRVSRLPVRRVALPRRRRPGVGQLGAGLRSDRPVPLGEPARSRCARTAGGASRPTRT